MRTRQRLRAKRSAETPKQRSMESESLGCAASWCASAADETRGFCGGGPIGRNLTAIDVHPSSSSSMAPLRSCEPCSPSHIPSITERRHLTTRSPSHSIPRCRPGRLSPSQTEPRQYSVMSIRRDSPNTDGCAAEDELPAGQLDPVRASLMRKTRRLSEVL